MANLDFGTLVPSLWLNDSYSITDEVGGLLRKCSELKISFWSAALMELDDQDPPKALDYASPVTGESVPPAGAIAGAVICLGIGIPLCALGVGVLTAVEGWNDRDLWRSLGFIAVGGLFCFAGMKLKRRT